MLFTETSVVLYVTEKTHSVCSEAIAHQGQLKVENDREEKQFLVFYVC